MSDSSSDIDESDYEMAQRLQAEFDAAKRKLEEYDRKIAIKLQRKEMSRADPDRRRSFAFGDDLGSKLREQYGSNESPASPSHARQSSSSSVSTSKPPLPSKPPPPKSAPPSTSSSPLSTSSSVTADATPALPSKPPPSKPAQPPPMALRSSRSAKTHAKSSPLSANSSPSPPPHFLHRARSQTHDAHSTAPIAYRGARSARGALQHAGGVTDQSNASHHHSHRPSSNSPRGASPQQQQQQQRTLAQVMANAGGQVASRRGQHRPLPQVRASAPHARTQARVHTPPTSSVPQLRVELVSPRVYHEQNPPTPVQRESRIVQQAQETVAPNAPKEAVSRKDRIMETIARGESWVRRLRKSDRPTMTDLVAKDQPQVRDWPHLSGSQHLPVQHHHSSSAPSAASSSPPLAMRNSASAAVPRDSSTHEQVTVRDEKQISEARGKLDQLKGLSARAQVVAELLLTESTFVRDVRLLRDLYKKPLGKREDLLPRASHAFIFRHVDQLFECVDALCKRLGLQDCVYQSMNDDSAALRQAERLTDSVCALYDSVVDDKYRRAFGIYVAHFEGAQDAWVRACEANETLLQWSRRQEEVAKQLCGANRSFGQLFIHPFQRICRYPLLFRELDKLTDETHPDYKALKSVIEKFAKLNGDVNEAKRELENLNRARYLISALRRPFDTALSPRNRISSFADDRLPSTTQLDSEYLTPNAERRLLREGSCPIMIDGKSHSDAYLLLFSDCLVHCKRKEDAKQADGFSYKLRHVIPLESTVLSDTYSPQRADKRFMYSFELCSMVQHRKVVILTASIEERIGWLYECEQALADHAEPKP